MRNSVREFLAFVVNGGTSSAGMPPRVQDEIRRREADAERLIGWVQLGVVVAFATLYSVAPRAEGGSGHSFVPVTLTAYFIFTLLRVTLSYRIKLPWWFLVLSIIVDVALLCGLIFSFHLQYDQPAAFYLKSPTMIYLFIFISLRALRFDPRYVLVTGLVATVGWLLMVAYALRSDMGQMYITRNYVEYLNSNSILIGAEIDKSVTLLSVTLILSLALYRARYVAFLAVQSSNAANDLKNFFSPEVFKSITSSKDLPGAGHCETRDAAVMFVDVRSFTVAAQTLPAEVVMQVLALYQHTALTEIERFGGRVDKFIGDGILATFGAVDSTDTFAADALHAARAIIHALDAKSDVFTAFGWPGPFISGVAVAAGSLTVGVIGAAGRLEFTVIGNPVNLAAKLENANKVQATRALTDAETLGMARAQGFADPINARRGATVDGLSHQVDLVVLA